MNIFKILNRKPVDLYETTKGWAVRYIDEENEEVRQYFTNWTDACYFKNLCER